MKPSFLLAVRLTLPIKAFIVLGACVTLASSLGLLGVASNNRGVMLSFAILLGILILGQVILIVSAASARKTTADLVDRSWSNAWKRTPRVIRDVEETFQCCGLKDTKDRAYPKSSPDACEKSPDFGYKVRTS